jgi:hypothetical protein
MSFDAWWFKNKGLYTSAGVSESMAKCIWNDAVQSVELPVTEQIKLILESLEEE